MKVCIVSLARRGGMVHFHAELVNSMSAMANVLALTSASASQKHYSSNIKKVTVNMGDGKLGALLQLINPWTWIDVARKIKGDDPDVFHIVASHEWNPILAFSIKVVGKPLVFTVHDPKHHLGAPVYIRISDFFTIKMADYLIVLTDRAIEQLIKRGVPVDLIYKIPHGEYTIFSQKNVQVERENVILFFGRIEPYKGIDLLLKAFSLASKRLPGWKLIIAGNGDFTPYESLARDRNIEIINRYIPDEEIAALMQRSRMVVLPYIEATQSGVIPTAYSFSRPVIISDVGGLSEMVIHNETGLIVPPNNIEQLLEAIVFLASNDQAAQLMGAAGHRLANTEWNWGKIASLHLGVYLDALKSK